MGAEAEKQSSEAMEAKYLYQVNKKKWSTKGVAHQAENGSEKEPTLYGGHPA